MKKLWSFLRSMQFGMLLLILVMLCSLAGSLIAQQGAPMAYVNEYGASAASVLIFLGLTDIFHTWYFYALEVLLCLNLVLCSVVRFPKAVRAAQALRQKAAAAQADQPITKENSEQLRQLLKTHGFKERDGVFSKNGVGFYGSFLVHISILVILAFGSLALMTPKILDETLMPGSTMTLEDGTIIRCDRFHIMDESGKLDYASTLHAESADGSRSADQIVRVNEPLRFGRYKIYQNTYGTAGQVQIINHQNGAQEVFSLTEACFLSIDGRNGLYFVALYPGYVEEADGSYTLVSSTSGGYADPVYDVRVIADGMSTSVLAFPGEELSIGEMSFTFMPPVEYPGLRIKGVSPALYGGLYFGFGLMVLALYLCFFTVPVCVKVAPDGYAVHSPKEAQELLIAIAALTEDEKEKAGGAD